MTEYHHCSRLSEYLMAQSHTRLASCLFVILRAAGTLRPRRGLLAASSLLPCQNLLPSHRTMNGSLGLHGGVPIKRGVCSARHSFTKDRQRRSNLDMRQRHRDCS